MKSHSQCTCLLLIGTTHHPLISYKIKYFKQRSVPSKQCAVIPMINDHHCCPFIHDYVWRNVKSMQIKASLHEHNGNTISADTTQSQYKIQQHTTITVQYFMVIHPLCSSLSLRSQIYPSKYHSNQCLRKQLQPCHSHSFLCIRLTRVLPPVQCNQWCRHLIRLWRSWGSLQPKKDKQCN